MTQITLVERSAELPSYESAIANLARVPEILYQGFEHAAFEVSQFKNQHSPAEQLEPGLAATLFRFFAISFLKKEGIDAQPDELKWMFDRVPFLGISFYFDGYHVRVLKGPDGSLPGCGVSKRKKRFFRQVPTSYLIGQKVMRSTANLVVLWDMTFSYGLSGLWLALPAEGAKRQQDVSAFWCEPIMHPAEAAVPQSPPPTDPTEGIGELIAAVDSGTAEEQEQHDRRQDQAG